MKTLKNGSVEISEPNKKTILDYSYGKLNNDNYGFVFTLRGTRLGAIIPTEKNVVDDSDFNDYLMFALKQVERSISYEA